MSIFKWLETEAKRCNFAFDRSEWETVHSFRSPTQMNGVDCGVNTLWCAYVRSLDADFCVSAAGASVTYRSQFRDSRIREEEGKQWVYADADMWRIRKYIQYFFLLQTVPGGPAGDSENGSENPDNMKSSEDEDDLQLVDKEPSDEAVERMPMDGVRGDLDALSRLVTTQLSLRCVCLLLILILLF